MPAQGTATISFGSTPTRTATVVVTDPNLAGLTYAEAWIMGSDSNGDHNTTLHRQANALIRLTCDAPSGSNMTVRADVLMGLVTGNFVFRYAAN